jgi:thioesterase DpgC
MIQTFTSQEHRARLLKAALPIQETSAWLDAVESFRPSDMSDRTSLAADATLVGVLIRQGREFCRRLPLKSERNAVERAAGESLTHWITSLCRAVCHRHRAMMYEILTDNYSRFLRVDALARRGAEHWPGLLPGTEELVAEQEFYQKDKDGLELNQGIFISQLLGEPRSGIHLLQAMLQAKPESRELLPQFVKDGGIELPHASVEVNGASAVVYLTNPRYLNAEDENTANDQETAVDLVLLHPQVSIGVLRGAHVDHPRYAGRRVFCSGINLTKIYQGKLPFLMYLLRDFGLVNKLYYGLAGPIWDEDDPNNSLEKPWIGVIESFAIGGGCQFLLTMDYILAESGSYFNLPARKEGIIPGAANLRLARFLGESAAREAIMFDRTFHVGNPDAAGLVNQVVPRGQMDAALAETIGKALDSGMVSASGNRKVLRVAQESLEIYRRYMANYAELQAYCHLSDQLIVNLEKHWNAKQRTL